MIKVEKRGSGFYCQGKTEYRDTLKDSGLCTRNSIGMSVIGLPRELADKAYKDKTKRRKKAR